MAIRIIALLLMTAAASLLVAQPVPAAPQAVATQIVFSATAEPGSFGGSGDPHYGFWIWCEVSRTSPYNGICNGSMYFYAIEIFTERVMGTVTLNGQQATITVASSATAPEYINCTLSNLTVMPGPTNTVTVSCTNDTTKPGPRGSETATDVIVAIVNIVH